MAAKIPSNSMPELPFLYFFGEKGKEVSRIGCCYIAWQVIAFHSALLRDTSRWSFLDAFKQTQILLRCSTNACCLLWSSRRSIRFLTRWLAMLRLRSHCLLHTKCGPHRLSRYVRIARRIDFQGYMVWHFLIFHKRTFPLRVQFEDLVYRWRCTIWYILRIVERQRTLRDYESARLLESKWPSSRTLPRCCPLSVCDRRHHECTAWYWMHPVALSRARLRWVSQVDLKWGEKRCMERLQNVQCLRRECHCDHNIFEKLLNDAVLYVAGVSIENKRLLLTSRMVGTNIEDKLVRSVRKNCWVYPCRVSLMEITFHEMV